MFTDYYGEQSCTAGRSAFITGQHPLRTGLLKVGMPGADIGLQAEDPTIAELLKPLGYATAQFGKNHLGDKDKFLPTNHGFDEFFGNLYHLNAEEEPETYFYPKGPEFRKRFAPRGVIHSYADGKIEDTGPLTRKRMEIIDQEFADGAIRFMGQAHKDNKPFFIWFNSTRMHVWTRLAPKWQGSSGYGLYADGMMEHDYHVGLLLDELDKLGIADSTFVVIMGDNGHFTKYSPQSGFSPMIFRGGKVDTTEGGVRVDAFVRWPGMIEEDAIVSDIVQVSDLYTTLARVAGAEGYIPRDRLVDGVDQSALWLLGETHGRRDTVFIYSGNVLKAVVKEQYKLNVPGRGENPIAAKFYDLYRDTREEWPVSTEIGAWGGQEFVRTSNAT